MQKAKFAVSCILALLFIVSSFQAAQSAPIDDLIAGAKKEGTFELYAPSTLTPEGAQRLGEAFNKKYGLNIKLKFTPAGAMTREVGKIVSIAATPKAMPAVPIRARQRCRRRLVNTRVRTCMKFLKCVLRRVRPVES